MALPPVQFWPYEEILQQQGKNARFGGCIISEVTAKDGSWFMSIPTAHYWQRQDWSLPADYDEDDDDD